jgi:hypothetical protein
MNFYDRFRRGNEREAHEPDNLELAQPTGHRMSAPDYGDENDEPEEYSNQMLPSNYMMRPDENATREEYPTQGIGAFPPPLAEDPTVQGNNLSDPQNAQDRTNHVDPSSVGMSQGAYDHTLTRSRRSAASTFRRRELLRREEERKFKRTICLVIAAVVAWCILAAVVGGIVGTLL